MPFSVNSVFAILKYLNLHLIAFGILAYATAIKFSENPEGMVFKNAFIIGLIIFIIATFNDYLKPSNTLEGSKVNFLNENRTVLFRAIVLATLGIGGLLFYAPKSIQLWTLGVTGVSALYLYVFNRIWNKPPYDFIRVLVQSILLVMGIWGMIWLHEPKSTESLAVCLIFTGLFLQNSILKRIYRNKKKTGITANWTKISYYLLILILVMGTYMCYNLTERFLIRLLLIAMATSVIQAISLFRKATFQQFKTTHFLLDWILLFPALVF